MVLLRDRKALRLERYLFCLKREESVPQARGCRCSTKFRPSSTGSVAVSVVCLHDATVSQHKKQNKTSNVMAKQSETLKSVGRVQQKKDRGNFQDTRKNTHTRRAEIKVVR